MIAHSGHELSAEINVRCAADASAGSPGAADIVGRVDCIDVAATPSAVRDMPTRANANSKAIIANRILDPHRWMRSGILKVSREDYCATSGGTGPPDHASN